MDDKKSISFGFKKKIQTKVDESKVVKDAPEEGNTKDFLTEVDAKSLQKVAPKELVIPLISKNRYVMPKKEKQQTNDKNTGIEDEAAKELMAESKQFLDQAPPEEQSNEDFENMAVPLLLRNKVPDGYEDDTVLDVSIRPEEATIADYEQIPIQAFGMAMLRGMGWNPEVGIGRTFKKNTKMLETVVRPKGLGLGANAPNKKLPNGQSGNKEDEALEIKKGGFVFVNSGSHKNKYGVVEGMDPDNAQCVISFALGGTASVGQFALKAIAKSEYEKYSKDISRTSGRDKNSDNRSKNKRNTDINNDSDQKRDDSSHKRKHKKRQKEEEETNHKRSRHAHEEHQSRSKHKRRHYEEDINDSDHKKSRSVNSSPKRKNKSKKSSPLTNSGTSESDSERKYLSSKPKPTWLRPHLKVRMVDKKYKKGKYFREKLIVVDVLDATGRCSCKSEQGILLDDVREEMLETVVPKSISDAYVSITSRGRLKHDGKLAKILEKDRSNCRAYLQLLEDRDVCLDVDFDDICEYVGDVEAEDMF
ncbi:G-patch domain and KOW motifs-containing protein-like [Ciona intestinalis]